MKAYEKFDAQNGLHNIYHGPLSDVPKARKSVSFIFDGERFLYWQGYLWVYRPEHPRAFGEFVKVCILKLEEKLGRPLEEGEWVHHIDEDRINDSKSNLEPSTKAAHYANHRLLIPKENRKQDPTLKAKRLCANDVLEIRKLRQDGMKMQVLADLFNVGRTAIQDVISGKCWAYIKS